MSIFHPITTLASQARLVSEVLGFILGKGSWGLLPGQDVRGGIPIPLLYFCLAPQRAVVVAAVPNEIREEGEAWGKHRHLRVNGREEKMVPNEIREEGEAWGKHRHLRVNGREEKRLTWQRTL